MSRGKHDGTQRRAKLHEQRPNADAQVASLLLGTAMLATDWVEGHEDRCEGDPRCPIDSRREEVPEIFQLRSISQRKRWQNCATDQAPSCAAPRWRSAEAQASAGRRLSRIEWNALFGVSCSASLGGGSVVGHELTINICTERWAEQTLGSFPPCRSARG